MRIKCDVYVRFLVEGSGYSNRLVKAVVSFIIIFRRLYFVFVIGFYFFYWSKMFFFFDVSIECRFDIRFV